MFESFLRDVYKILKAYDGIYINYPFHKMNDKQADKLLFMNDQLIKTELLCNKGQQVIFCMRHGIIGHGENIFELYKDDRCWMCNKKVDRYGIPNDK